MGTWKLMSNFLETSHVNGALNIIIVTDVIRLAIDLTRIG